MPPVSSPRRRRGRARGSLALAGAVLVLAAPALLERPAAAARPAATARHPSFRIPASADELIVVSSPTYDPAGYLATLQTFQRANAYLALEARLSRLAGRDGLRTPA